MKTAEIRRLSDEELVHAEMKAERELCTLQVKHALKQLDNHSQLRSVRKEIARYRTIQREREIERGMGAESLRREHARSFKAEVLEKIEPTTESKGFLRGIVDKIRGTE
jgi:large subunit ribosomal protein L29